MLEASGRERVLVIWLEDLHWADHSTLEAIAFLARRSEPTRLMLLGTSRPTALLAPDHPLARITHELALHGQGRELALTRLGEPAVAEYLAVRLAGTPVSSRLVRRVYRTTDGNPLFMVTVADDLVARALIVEGDGQWTLAEAQADRPPDVPATLRRLIEQQAHQLTIPDHASSSASQAIPTVIPVCENVGRPVCGAGDSRSCRMLSSYGASQPPHRTLSDPARWL